ncbi:MAG: DMT family transporter [Proteobacteria bacterium]|nr:DMT family transporter [Pseudomonadota bacterium]MBS0492400.1 DMT family transporter [Pseudomonadota bacterium]
MSTRLTGYLLLALAMMTVGTTVIASKLLAGNIAPFLATALRLAIALPVLLALAWLRGERWPALTRREGLLLTLQAAAGSVGYTAFLVAGTAHLPAADAGVVIGTLPAMAALFAAVVLGERPGPRLVLAVLLATGGVLAVAWNGRAPTASAGLSPGVLLVLAAVVCESAFILLHKRMARPLPPLAQDTAMTGLGLLVALPLAAFELPAATLPPPNALAAVAWYALVPTVGGYLLWYAGAARVSGSEAAAFTAVAPLTAVVLAALWLGETVGARQALGAVAVLLAILVLALPRRG